jgi:protein-tyrosine phosphatase
METLIAGLKAPLKWLLGVATRSLHPLRRRAAERRLETGVPYRSVMFICLGNVCRSPYAEVSFRAIIARSNRGGPAVDSAGFIGPDRGSPETAVAVATARELDLTPHVSKLMTQALTTANDLIVVMEPRQERALRRRFATRGSTLLVLGDLDPQPPTRRRILDPWGGDPERFRGTFDRIDRCLEELARIVAVTDSPATVEVRAP